MNWRRNKKEEIQRNGCFILGAQIPRPPIRAYDSENPENVLILDIVNPDYL